MSEIERSTAAHYTQRNLYESIMAALARMGKTPDQVTAEDLAPVDSFHIRGRAAGWYSGIEFIIWSLVSGDCTSFEFSEVHAPFSLTSKERAEWRFLASEANGWPTFEAFLSLEEWEKLYADNRP